MNKRGGFTLIELLVVISIIGVLSAVMINNINSARGKSYNATRLHNLQQLKTAFHLYANDHGGDFPLSNGRYCLGVPTGSKCWNGYTYTGGAGNGYDGSSSLITALAPYIASIPLDPVPTRSAGDAYIYTKGLSESWHCTNPVPPITGSFIVWMPEIMNPTSDKSCGSGSFSCCGPLNCGTNVTNNYFCVLPLD